MNTDEKPKLDSVYTELWVEANSKAVTEMLEIKTGRRRDLKAGKGISV